MSDPADAARVAAAAWRLPEPEHLRTGMSSLFIVDDERVLRVTRDGAGMKGGEWLAHELLRRGVRVPRPLRDEPLRHGDWTVAMVERIHPDGEVDWEDVGRMVRLVHDIPPAELAARLTLPWCGSFAHWNLDRQFADLCAHIDPEAKAGMRACLQRWDGWRHVLLEQPSVVCHGDLHPGNVMPTARGSVLIDWDMMCIGPPAWDHAPLMRWEHRWTDRWGGGPGTYAAFARGYRRSMVDDWTGEALAEMRLLVATLGRVRAADADPAAQPELERRLQWWRGHPDAPRWEPQ